MRYKPKSVSALQVALGGLPAAMHVEADRDIGLSAKTVGELRKMTEWPENLVISTPQERNSQSESGSARPHTRPVPRQNRSSFALRTNQTKKQRAKEPRVAPRKI